MEAATGSNGLDLVSLANQKAQGRTTVAQIGGSNRQQQAATGSNRQQQAATGSNRQQQAAKGSSSAREAREGSGDHYD